MADRLHRSLVASSRADLTCDDFSPAPTLTAPPVGVHTALSCSIREMPSRLSKPPPQHKQKSSLFAIHLDDEPRRGRSHVFLFSVPNGKVVPFLLSRLVAGCLFLRHPSHLHPRGPPECTGSVSPSVERKGETEREREREGKGGWEESGLAGVWNHNQLLAFKTVLSLPRSSEN